MNDAVLHEQIAYYRARAHEYDAAVPLGPPPGLHLPQQMGPFEQVLELACGSGIWTQALLSIGREITAVDAAPDMLEINAAGDQRAEGRQRTRPLPALASW